MTVSEIQSAHLDQIYPVLKTVKQITFRGGEPLINKRHEEILNHLISEGAAGNIALTYTTNGTVIPDRLKSLWVKFKRVTVWISLDGTGETNDFIRFPSKWNELELNLKKMNEWAGEVPHLCWGITTTVQAHNLHALADLVALTSNFKTCYPYPFVNTLHYPPVFKVENLPGQKIQTSIAELKRAMMETIFKSEDPIDRALSKVKMLAENGERNKAAILKLIQHLESHSGGNAEAVRKLKEQTEKIIQVRKITALNFLRHVF